MSNNSELIAEALNREKMRDNFVAQGPRYLMVLAERLATALSTAQGEVEALRAAGQRVLNGLNARIDAAPTTAVPVFDGIVDLQDALFARTPQGGDGT